MYKALNSLSYVIKTGTLSLNYIYYRRH